MKFSKTNLIKLEEILAKLGYKIRYEKGNFTSGYCIVDQKRMIIINKFFDVEGRIHVLLDILQTIEIKEESLDEKNLIQLKNFLKETT
ncbi:MAG: hypothetical protein IPN79_13520 [Saprospiraceae bacterium]|nr:hypothetical protein [Saprospiraceae bacterium]